MIKSDKELTEAMKLFFRNKDEIKAIKFDRSEYFDMLALNMNENRCEYKNGIEPPECIVNDNLPKQEWCEVCKKRNSYWLRLKELKNLNIAILNKVRNYIKRNHNK